MKEPKFSLLLFVLLTLLYVVPGIIYLYIHIAKRRKYKKWLNNKSKNKEWRNAQETRDALPYFKYISTMDEHTNPAHRALHGLVLPIDDPFWDDHTPPWSKGCRCQLVLVSEYDVNQQRKLEKKLPKHQRRILDKSGIKLLRKGFILDENGNEIDIRHC